MSFNDTLYPEVGDDIGPSVYKGPLITGSSPPADSASSSGARAAEVAFGLYGALSITSAALSAYHGFRRGGFWAAVGWGLAGLVFPIVTPTIAYAQGYAKRRPRGK